MKRTVIKRLSTSLCAVLMLCTMLCGCAGKKAEIVAEGSVDNLRWALDAEGCLSFTGTGAIPGVEYILDAQTGQTVTVRPSWYDHRSAVTDIVIGGEIDSVSMNAFMSFGSLRTIDFGASVEHIDGYAVSGCPSLERVIVRAADPVLEKYCIGYVGGTPEDAMASVVFEGVPGSETQSYARECGAKFSKL